jgi:hypothetical protein
VKWGWDKSNIPREVAIWLTESEWEKVVYMEDSDVLKLREKCLKE